MIQLQIIILAGVLPFFSLVQKHVEFHRYLLEGRNTSFDAFEPCSIQTEKGQYEHTVDGNGKSPPPKKPHFIRRASFKVKKQKIVNVLKGCTTSPQAPSCLIAHSDVFCSTVSSGLQIKKIMCGVSLVRGSLLGHTENENTTKITTGCWMEGVSIDHLQNK